MPATDQREPRRHDRRRPAHHAHRPSARHFRWRLAQSAKQLGRGLPARACGRTPGQSFIYSSASSFMLSAIVTRVSGQTMHALLQERVLGFLGMDKLEWDLAPGGFNSGGNGLSCTTEDSLKFGVLHLNKGQWQGRQLLSPQWIAAATRNQVEDVWMGEFDGKQYLPRNKDGASEVQRGGYGYQWWMTRHGGYYASGVFGQYCMVLPDQETVLAFTCGLQLGERRLQAAIWEYLFPALGRAARTRKRPGCNSMQRSKACACPCCRA
nr:serine hydrolase [Pseudomonas sp. TH10]